MRRAKKRKNLSSARHYDQIRFRFHTAKTHNSTGIALETEALLAVAAEMRKIGGADCVTARIGGDEFGVVLSANCDALTAPHLRATLKSGVVCSTSAAGKPVFVSASVGVVYPDDGTTASELLKSADKSMYAQKRGLISRLNTLRILGRWHFLRHTRREDARGLAQLIRMGWFRPVHAKSMGSQEVRALLVARKQLLGRLIDVELSIRGILRGFGLDRNFGTSSKILWSRHSNKLILPFGERAELFYSGSVNLENFKIPSIVGHPRPRLRPVVELR